MLESNKIVLNFKGSLLFQKHDNSSDVNNEEDHDNLYITRSLEALPAS